MKQLVALMGFFVAWGMVGVAQARGIEEGIRQYIEEGIPVDITFDDVTYEGIPFLAYTAQENERSEFGINAEQRATDLCRVLGHGELVAYSVKSRVRSAQAYTLGAERVLVLGTYFGESQKTLTKTMEENTGRKPSTFTATIPAKTWAIFTSISCAIIPDEADGSDDEEDNLFFRVNGSHIERF